MSGRKTLCLTVCVAIALEILSRCDGCQSGPQSSPESVVRAWIEAVRHGDCDKAESYTHPELGVSSLTNAGLIPRHQSGSSMHRLTKWM